MFAWTLAWLWFGRLCPRQVGTGLAQVSFRYLCSGWWLTALSDNKKHQWAYVQSAVLVSICSNGRHVLSAHIVGRKN